MQQTRQGWQREIDALILLVGETNLPADLLAALRSGTAALRDDSGRFVEQTPAGDWHADDRPAAGTMTRSFIKPSPTGVSYCRRDPQPISTSRTRTLSFGN